MKISIAKGVGRYGKIDFSVEDQSVLIADNERGFDKANSTEEGL
jgi:hypothetical protein